MRSPRYTILIANRKTGAVRRLTVSRRVLGLAATLLFVCPCPCCWVRVARARLSCRHSRSSNETLRIENDSYRDATGELTDQISSLQTALTQLERTGRARPGHEGRHRAPAGADSCAGGRRRIRSPPRTAAPAAPPENTIRHSSRPARHARIRAQLGEVARRDSAGAGARDSNVVAGRRVGCRRVRARARIRLRGSRTSTRASTSPPDRARRSARRRTARSSRPPTTAITATPS